MRTFGLLIFTIFVVSCATTKVIDYDSAIEKQDVEINELIHEYLIVTGAEANQDKMINLMSDQMIKSFGNSISKTIARQSFQSPMDKSNAILVMNKAMDNFFNRYKTELRELMPFSEIEKDIYAPILIDLFSADELKHIISFYSSPIGKKYVELIPTILEQSIAKTNELYFAKITRLSETIANEELDKVQNEIELLK